MMMNLLLTLGFAAVVLGAPRTISRKFAVPLQPSLIPEEEGDNLIDAGGYNGKHGRQAPIYKPEKRSASLDEYGDLDSISMAEAVYNSVPVDEPYSSEERGQFELRMPNSKPTEPETYLCTTIRLDENNTYFVTGFDPKAKMGTAHHMLLFGCEEPGQREELFSCGEMGRVLEGTKQAPPCRRGQQIIYAWARDAPKLELPEDVGFRVGGGGEIKYLVLQVHYAAVDKIPDSGDRSGVVLTYTDQPQRKRAGVYFIGTNGMIAPKTTTYMEAACKLNTKLTLHPFAFRTHTHALGRVVSGWKVTEDMQWSLIGKEDPQKPQMFYPVSDSSMTVTGGDTLAARCTMVSYRDRVTWVGATAEDEMCNFYMMYWVEGEEKLANERCNSVGPPVYTWDRWLVGGGLSNIPDDASSLL